MTVRTTLRQASKFGVGGILGAAISATLYYGYRGSLPEMFLTVWAHRINLIELRFYMLTSILGGSASEAVCPMNVSRKLISIRDS